MLICNNSQKSFNVVLFDSEEYVPNKGEGKSEPYYDFESQSYYLNNFNIIYMQSVADYILINDRDFSTDKGYVTNKLILKHL